MESNVTTLRKEPSAHDDPNEEEIGDNREEDNTEISVDWSSLRIENEDGYGFGLLDEDTVFMTMGFGVDDYNTEHVANNPPDVPVIPDDVEDDIADACMVVNDGDPSMKRNNKSKSELGRKKTRNDAEASTSSVGNPTATRSSTMETWLQPSHPPSMESPSGGQPSSTPTKLTFPRKKTACRKKLTPKKKIE
ncbi:hypothetical protein GUJ93_ZPchr0008g14129 [Zizania palustris]|uniref:Uncharacterized protein n=1 Tax=Zizania palustris TaxID=103762 RepID=A0A8J5QZN0_ZIZPA|nr:hypothetical protein GUJ93_ZPchr0008g14129 [Zizania palustris]